MLRDAAVHVNSAAALPSAKQVRKESPLEPELNNLWVSAEAQVTDDAELNPDPILPLQIGNTIFKARLLRLTAGDHCRGAARWCA